MDPRLSPSLSPHRPNMVQDVKPPQAAVPPANTVPATPPVAPLPQAPPASFEVVGSIPMAQPGKVAASPPTFATPPPVLPSDNPQTRTEPEDDLDKILQAVNNRVQVPMKPQPKAKKEILSKVAAKAAKAKGLSKNSKPVGAMIAVVVVALTLCALAVYAYHQGAKSTTLASQAGKVGTSSAAAASIQAAGGTLVRPSDLDDYSQTLSSQLNSLNDSQDFSATPLSDAVLGL
jgi:hypothetical protein